MIHCSDSGAKKMVFILRTIKLVSYGTAKHRINIFRGNHTPAACMHLISAEKQSAALAK
jgi:hypothetical protein